ncbi:hypothetical protein WICMUC_003585 [Wickerhamomyces mucosus]|uniref:Methyltransferase type 11 domain-containing protein n=1 Tax=Wickerhamomyces mucosus TaxID=1378264 RepID=A0A9P8PJT5_9ASCO|nr:hypothetical protein WICMUC_003585 [Wickerhamomyces mucosus]
MSAFSDSNFKSSNYSSFRPSYDESLFKYIATEYHKGEYDLALDLGSGTGQATYPLTKYFKKVIGTDLSSTMIATANSKITEEFKDKIEFKVSPAEESPFLPDQSVDLITAAQCAHWFNHPKFFQEVDRILKPNGTLAIWGYIDPVFNIEEIDNFALEFMYGDKYLGPYWENPGRLILRKKFKDVIPPSNIFEDEVVFEHDPRLQNKAGSSPLIIKKTLPFETYFNYTKTWSSYHSWKKQNPDKEEIADWYYKKLQSKTGWTPQTIVNYEFITILKLVRKIKR